MTIEAVSFIIGGVLIATAIIGGGFEIKEIKMPHVGAGPRFCSLIVGSFFILIGLGMWEVQNGGWADPQAAVSALTPGGTPLADTRAPGTADAPVAEPTQSFAEQILAEPDPQSITPDFSGIEGRVRLSWSIEGVPINAEMETYGSTGVIRVAYVNASGYEEQVDQDLVLYQDAHMLAYHGANPRYAGTNNPVPEYAPDVFRLVEVQSGRWSITEVCDGLNACVPVTAEVVQ